MQIIEQNNVEIDMLSDAELDMINGGNCVGDFFRAIGGAIEGAAVFVGEAIWAGLHGQPGPWRGPFQH
jgi:hypothetical protein